MSKRYYDIAKRNYDSGMWNRAMVEHLLELGRLTQEEFNDIVGDGDE